MGRRHINRHMDQWKRIESPEINPHTFSQLIFNKGGKNILRRKDSLFNKWCWESWTAACKTIKLEHNLTPYTKKTSKWLKDLNIRHDTIKLLEKNIGKTFSDISHTDVFLGHSPKAIEIKAKNKHTAPNQTYKLLHSKGSQKQTKRQPRDWEKILANDAINKGLISKIYKLLIQLNNKKNKQPNQKMGRRPK